MVSSLDTGASVSILDDGISFHELKMAHWILQLGMNLIQSFIASHRVVSCLSLRDDWHFEFDDVFMSVVLRMEIICGTQRLLLQEE